MKSTDQPSQSGRVVPVDAINDLPARAAIELKSAQMGECLSRGERGLFGDDFPVEEQAEAVNRPFGFFKRQGDPVKPLFMLGPQRQEPCVQTAEGLPMRWADQQIVRQMQEFFDGGQPFAQGIAFRLDRTNRYV